MAGPLKGKLLPRETARQNLQMLFGFFEPNVVSEFLGLTEKVRVAYDVGAHVGYMTLVLAECVGKEGVVFAFEPVPNNQVLIEGLIFLNGLNGKVRLIPLALGDTVGDQKIIIRESSFMNQLEKAACGNTLDNRPVIHTAVTTIDAFIFKQANPPPELIKIDVEGAEAMVLAGGMKTLQCFSPRLLLEIHGAGNAGKTYDLLQSLEYEWTHLGRLSSDEVSGKQQLLSYFSRNSWTHHFMLTQKKRN